MTTPIADFVRRYARSNGSRLHMPGHKGHSFLGCEPLDITEVMGADALYEADGIIRESEQNATALFGTRATFYSTEGSSQCIRAMLHIALKNAPRAKERPFALAGRNAHKAFVYAAALNDFDVEWLYPEAASGALCACPVTPDGLSRVLSGLARAPFCVYVTSPDYLGGTLDIAGLAAVCHARRIPLLVDDAHGAYQKFLQKSCHPIDLDADMCCDSAHKTLPVLTGGAYLHVAREARYAEDAKAALSLFGSTSPSYLILQSLDLCNRYLAEGYAQRLAACVSRVNHLKAELCARGWIVENSDPLKLTLNTDGGKVADCLRANGVEIEYADPEHAVMMFTPENAGADFSRIERALIHPLPAPAPGPAFFTAPRAMSIREAVFSPRRRLPVKEALGRICAAPAVSCPPAVPIAVSGEIITPEAMKRFERYGIPFVDVVDGRPSNEEISFGI